MSGAGGGDLYVSSWFCKELDGELWWFWRVRWKGELKTYVATRGKDSTEALLLAGYMSEMWR